MKKIFNILGIIILVIIILICIGIIFLLSQKAVPKDYYNKVDTIGDIESKYIQIGTHDVKNINIKAMQNFKSYKIWYPTDIETSNKKYPLVIFSNGTGVKASKYSNLLEHLASWGFIVMGTEEEYSWNGFSSKMCLKLMTKLNNTKDTHYLENNIFYGKVDLNNIGVSGHSQGGVGAINAVNNMEYGHMYKAIYSASMTNKELSSALEWDYTTKEITIPTLLVAGIGNFDNAVLPLEQMKSIYNDIPENTIKLMARRKNIDHGDMLYYGDGYMTAWFMWLLKGDEEASKAFIGSDAEILNNKNWQDGISNIK